MATDIVGQLAPNVLHFLKYFGFPIYSFGKTLGVVLCVLGAQILSALSGRHVCLTIFLCHILVVPNEATLSDLGQQPWTPQRVLL